MTTSTSERPSGAFVWAWLPDAPDPVVAGRIGATSDGYRFAYGESYLARDGAISLFSPELPLGAGWIEHPDGMEMAGCLWDSSPDSWGQRVIIARLTGRHGLGADAVELDKLTFLLESGSNRIGALDFQTSATTYTARTETATLDELHAAATALQAGDLRPELATALVDGTAVGGARPKVLVRDGGTEHIAKLSTTADLYPVVKAEAVGLELATRVGITTAGYQLTRSLGRDVLLVERFDRGPGRTRRMLLSGLTMLGFGDFLGARYSSYPDLLDVLRRMSPTGKNLARTVFERIVLNILISNTDDHARNHAAFWDGRHLELTPAYDLCPQPRSGTEANQAMDLTRAGARDARLVTMANAASEYDLTLAQAREIIDVQVTTIRESWDEVADLARLSTLERQAMYRRQILPPFAFDGYPR
jgi:serine/threonine-protein kinase HipA